jgi:hypothetical protein
MSRIDSRSQHEALKIFLTALAERKYESSQNILRNDIQSNVSVNRTYTVK